MAIEIVDFPIDSMVIFHSFLYVYQRVPILPGEEWTHVTLQGTTDRPLAC